MEAYERRRGLPVNRVQSKQELTLGQDHDSREGGRTGQNQSGRCPGLGDSRRQGKNYDESQKNGIGKPRNTKAVGTIDDLEAGPENNVGGLGPEIEPVDYKTLVDHTFSLFLTNGGNHVREVATQNIAPDFPEGS